MHLLLKHPAQAQCKLLTQGRLYNYLNTSPIFQQSEIDGKILWTYTPPTPPETPPLMKSLSALRASLPPSEPRQPKYQHTLQALSDFTGYIAAQTYTIPTNFRLGMSGATLSPEAEEARREIRALKGLVLNRYVLSRLKSIVSLMHPYSGDPSCHHPDLPFLPTINIFPRLDEYLS